MIVKMRFILTFLTALTAVVASAQETSLTVRGRVTDASTDEPIPFASVHLEGTMVGVSTDAEGEYVITIPENGALIFSSIGYRSKEVNIDGRTTLNISLEPDTESLEETIVIAYGTATKSSFTGSAAMVDASTIESRVSTNVPLSNSIENDGLLSSPRHITITASKLFHVRLDLQPFIFTFPSLKSFLAV